MPEQSSSSPTTGWPVWYPTAVMFFANGAIYGVWATQIPLAKIRLDLDPFVLSTALLMLGGGAVTAMVGSAWLLQRFGTAAVTRVSAVFFLAWLPLIGIAPNAWILSIVLFFFGAGGGCMDVAMNAEASNVEKRAGKPYMSSFHGMWSVGGLVGASLGTLLLNIVSGPVQGLVMALILAAIFVWGQRRLNPGFSTPVSVSGRLAAFRPSSVALIVGAMAALCFGSEGAVLDWAAVFLREHLGAGPELGNAGYVAFAGCMAIARFLGDPIRQRIDGVLVVRYGCLLAFAGLLAGPVSGNVAVAIAGYGLAGLGLANIVPVLFSSAGAMPRPEVQIAVISTLGYGGLLAAPPLLGFVAHATSLAGIYYITAVACVVIAALAGVCAPASTAGKPVTTAG